MERATRRAVATSTGGGQPRWAAIATDQDEAPPEGAGQTEDRGRPHHRLRVPEKDHGASRLTITEDAQRSLGHRLDLFDARCRDRRISQDRRMERGERGDQHRRCVLGQSSRCHLLLHDPRRGHGGPGRWSLRSRQRVRPDQHAAEHHRHDDEDGTDRQAGGGATGQRRRVADRVLNQPGGGHREHQRTCQEKDSLGPAQRAGGLLLRQNQDGVVPEVEREGDCPDLEAEPTAEHQFCPATGCSGATSDDQAGA